MNITDIDLIVLKLFYVPSATVQYILIALQYSLYIFALAILYYYLRKKRETFFHLLLALGIGFLLVFSLKYFVNRPRPYSEFPDLFHSVITKSDSSFPSDHSFVSFLLLSFIPVTLKKWYKYLIYIYLLFIPISMMVTGLHFPTDVLAGCLIGFLMPRLISNKLSLRIFKFFEVYLK